MLRWHYSHAMPAGKLVRFGVWEDRYIGAVLYGWGASPYLGREYDLDQTELCELVRVALRDHASPVSEIVARSLRMLRVVNPGLRLVVSFADPAQGHVGGIYQAGNWIYAGLAYSWAFRIRGQIEHPRGVSSRYGGPASLEWLRAHVDPGAERVDASKHRYLYPLDRRMRRAIAPLAQNYPAPLCRSS